MSPVLWECETPPYLLDEPLDEDDDDVFELTDCCKGLLLICVDSFRTVCRWYNFCWSNSHVVVMTVNERHGRLYYVWNSLRTLIALTFHLVAVFGAVDAVVVVVVLTSMIRWCLNLWQNRQWCYWLRSLKLLEDWCVVMIIFLHLIATVLRQRGCWCWSNNERCRRAVWLKPFMAASFIGRHSLLGIPSDGERG